MNEGRHGSWVASGGWKLSGQMGRGTGHTDWVRSDASWPWHVFSRDVPSFLGSAQLFLLFSVRPTSRRFFGGDVNASEQKPAWQLMG